LLRSRIAAPAFAVAQRDAEGAKVRIIFMGTPDFAVPSLDALVTAGHEVVAVYTQPPRRAGRGKALSPSPVHLRAETLGIDVMTPVSLRNAEEQARFSGLSADLAVVAAYGLILPQPILDATRLGCINVHASLLPRWRGAAPIHRAILAGDLITGVTIMGMEAGLDTGPMFARVETPVARKTGPELTSELAGLGAELLVKVLADLAAFPPEPQPEIGITYAAKIDKSETRIDFLVSAPQVERQIRAFAPLAYFEHQGERIRVLAAEVATPAEFPAGGDVSTVLDAQLSIACNPGVIRPTLVQRAGKSVMTTAELLRGFAIPPGTRLS
jgi:methionyl-tRNA formyltransferase